MFYSIFFVPETKGRSLEELDELFEHRPSIPSWKFASTKTTGVGAKVAALEGSGERSMYVDDSDTTKSDEGGK